MDDVLAVDTSAKASHVAPVPVVPARTASALATLAVDARARTVVPERAAAALEKPRSTRGAMADKKSVGDQFNQMVDDDTDASPNRISRTGTFELEAAERGVDPNAPPSPSEAASPSSLLGFFRSPKLSRAANKAAEIVSPKASQKKSL